MFNYGFTSFNPDRLPKIMPHPDTMLSDHFVTVVSSCIAYYLVDHPIAFYILTMFVVFLILFIFFFTDIIREVIYSVLGGDKKNSLFSIWVLYLFELYSKSFVAGYTKSLFAFSLLLTVFFFELFSNLLVLDYLDSLCVGTESRILLALATPGVIEFIFTNPYNNFILIEYVINNYGPLYKPSSANTIACTDSIDFVGYCTSWSKPLLRFACWSITKSNFIPFYFIYAVFMQLVVLLFVSISYSFLGYRNSFYNYYSIYLSFLPWYTVSLVYCFFFDFSINIRYDYLIIFLNTNVEPLSFIFDNLSVVFASTTFIIGFFTGVFQYVYLLGDLKKDRFFFLFNYFVYSMVFFVTSSNLILVILFWEMLGITSFFLIAHYDSRYLTARAAVKAFFFNRFSDVLLLLAAVTQYNNTGGLGIFNFFSGGCSTLGYVCFIPMFCIVMASFIKSAQIVFFFWLPDSMEAPIPASALIHSATLVSAGVYLLLRFNYSLLLWPQLSIFVLLASSITIILFSPIIFIQSDLKRLLAFSTIVNISFLYLLSVLVGAKITCMYFVVHGLFKSLCFMSFGCMVIYNNHCQDIRSHKNLALFSNRLGFLFFMCIFFLCGINTTFVYSIKHVFDFKSDFGYISSVLVDLSFMVYSVFSSLYGIKIFYFLYLKKIQNSVSYNNALPCLRLTSIMRLSNTLLCSYLLLSVFLSFILYLSIGTNCFYELGVYVVYCKSLFNSLSPLLLLYFIFMNILTVYNKESYHLLQLLIMLFAFGTCFICLIILALIKYIT